MAAYSIHGRPSVYTTEFVIHACVLEMLSRFLIVLSLEFLTSCFESSSEVRARWCVGWFIMVGHLSL